MRFAIHFQGERLIALYRNNAVLVDRIKYNIAKRVIFYAQFPLDYRRQCPFNHIGKSVGRIYANHVFNEKRRRSQA